MVRVSGPDGVLIVDKPGGKTSHDVVAQARRLFGTRAVGHAGTLDPMATGVLLLLFGEATKLSPFLTADDKRYRAEITLGRSTDTFDAEGEITEERVVPALEQSAVLAALSLEHSRSEQVPPSFSAIKVDGQRAHRLSRQGRPPELPPRPVTVHSLELVALDTTTLALEMSVSKGYFVRSLARDLCSSLGVPGHLSALRRLASGTFKLEEARPWPPPDTDLLSLSEAAARCLPVEKLRAESVANARQGKKLSQGDFETAGASAGPTAWLDPAGVLVAIGAREGDVYRVVRGFNLSAS